MTRRKLRVSKGLDLHVGALGGNRLLHDVGADRQVAQELLCWC